MSLNGMGFATPAKSRVERLMEIKGFTTVNQAVSFLKANGLLKKGMEELPATSPKENVEVAINDQAWDVFIRDERIKKIAAEKAARPIDKKIVDGTRDAARTAQREIQKKVGWKYGIVDSFHSLGIAVNGGITVDGKAFDAQNGTIVDMQGASLTMHEMFFALPVTELTIGDMVFYQGKVMAVKEVGEKVQLLDLGTGAYYDYAPEANFIGPKVYTKIFSPLSMFGVADYGSLAAKLKDLSVENINATLLPLVPALGLVYYGYKRNPRMLDRFVGTIKEEFIPVVAGSILSGAASEEWKDIPAKLLQVAQSSPLFAIAASILAFKIAKDHDLSQLIPFDFDMKDIGATEILLGVVGALALAQVSGVDVVGTVKSFVPWFDDEDLPEPDVDGAEVTE